jgi:hypothetical protein
LGMIPLTNHDSSEGEQWGRDEIYPDSIGFQFPSRNPWRHATDLRQVHPAGRRGVSFAVLGGARHVGLAGDRLRKTVGFPHRSMGKAMGHPMLDMIFSERLEIP